MKFAIVGAGSRGMVYGSWIVAQGQQVSAIADLRPDRLAAAAKAFGVPQEGCFASADALFAGEKLADAVVIASQDRDHFGHVMQALDRGYDILLEKPISPSARECLEIERRANALGRKITVCHVLRYTNFFATIKSVLDSGELGKIVSIKHSENIGNFHMAHSFVRGNWGRTETSSPIILAKSCHDLDILLWLTGAHCVKVASFGGLSYFRPENAPKDGTERCLDCPEGENCRYYAPRAYEPALGGWPTDVVCLEQTREALTEALRTGPYGRCVFRCGNDVCDHMSTILEFDNGVTATFSLSGQTNRVHRNIHIMCEKGEILADDGDHTVTVEHFMSNQAEGYASRVIHVVNGPSGHGGGDAGIVKDFIRSMEGKGDSRSSISRSVESHLMACAAEQSRLTGAVIELEDFRKSLGY